MLQTHEVSPVVHGSIIKTTCIYYCIHEYPIYFTSVGIFVVHRILHRIENTTNQSQQMKYVFIVMAITFTFPIYHIFS